jgi:uncharacterized lipoprotein YajG
VMTNLSASIQNLFGLAYLNRYRVMPQDMIIKAFFFIVLGVVMASCQHVSAEIKTTAQANVTEASSLEMESSVDDASVTDNGSDNSEASSEDYIFVEGRGYIVTWPPEERFVISPPDLIRKQMATKCATEGYITAFITSMELHDDKIIGYFLCRGIGG